MMTTASDLGTNQKHRLGERLFALFGVRLIVWLIAARAFLPGVLLDPVDKIGPYHDEHSAIASEESARRSYVDYHQLPEWEPVFCGGIVGIANAGSLTVAPDFLLRIFYGTLAGRRLALLLFVIIGMEGTFRYARANGSSALGAAMAAVAFSTSGGFYGYLPAGWGFMFHYNLLPWAALSLEKGLRKPWWTVVGGIATAWLLLGAGTYALPYTILVLVCLTVFETARAVTRADGPLSVKWWRPAMTFASIGVVGALISSIRLVPLLNFMSTHTRMVAQKDQTGPLSVFSMLVIPREHAAWGTGAGEYYVGGFVFVLGVVALLAGDRKAAKFWVLGLIFGVLACGEFIEYAPYLLMRKLPLFSQLRFPIRMGILCAFFVALAGAFGVTQIEDGISRFLEFVSSRLRSVGNDASSAIPLSEKVLFALITTAIAGSAAFYAAHDVVAHTSVARGAIYTMAAPQIHRGPYRQSRGNRWDAHVWAFANMGSLHCFDENEHAESPRLRGDLPAEEYPAPGSDMTVERVSWSPQKIVVRVHANAPGRFLVNQNYARAWKSDVGEIGSDEGLIRVDVPAGDHVVTLTYRDWGIRVGAVISVATLLVIAVFGAKRLRRRGAALLRWYDRLPESDSMKPAPMAPKSGGEA